MTDKYSLYLVYLSKVDTIYLSLAALAVLVLLVLLAIFKWSLKAFVFAIKYGALAYGLWFAWVWLRDALHF